MVEPVDVFASEAKDGVRCTWNYWPPCKLTATRNVIPLCALYTPLKPLENMALVEYPAVLCAQCQAVLNPSAVLDFIAKTWVCPICLVRNRFPAHYAQHISETTLPAELMPAHSTMEYILPHTNPIPPIFAFIIDTCCYDDELQELKSSLQQALYLLPEEALVCLITFGKNAYVYDLSWTECTRCYAFKGDKTYTLQNVKDLLGLVGHDPRGIQAGAKRFLMPVAECDMTLTAIIDEMKRDAWPVPSDSRPLRCTGNALFIAMSLLELAYPRQGAHIMLLAGGVCSYGPGRIVGDKKVDSIRTYHDIKNDTAKYMKPAIVFYNAMAQRAVTNCHSIDMFICAIDQVGLMEMKALVEQTNGYLIMTDSFTKDEFKNSFKKIFERDINGALRLAFNSVVELVPSRDVKICGAVGPGASAGKKTAAYLSDTEIGMSGTIAWTQGSIDTNTTLAFYLDLANQNPDPSRKRAALQFKTVYQHSSGRQRLRVTTVTYPLSEANNLAKFIAGFDQETAAVAMARYAIFKSEAEESIDVIRWLDRTLIRLAARFGEYQKELPHTFRLSKEFTLYPQFMFHLRRSQFLQTFNVSPDESAYFRAIFARENITNSLIMIQPALLQYTFNSSFGQPVMLDIASLKNDAILLLDSFFDVLIWHGDMVVKWRKEGYDEKPEFEHFRTLLQMPLDDAKAIMEQRFPVPKLTITEVGKGAERKLKAKVNPSQGVANNATVENGLFITDDVSFKVFYEHLVKLAVQS